MGRNKYRFNIAVVLISACALVLTGCQGERVAGQQQDIVLPNQPINRERFRAWVNKTLTEEWNKKAACRVFHICESGEDVKISEPFARGVATEKPVERVGQVPGASKKAANLYDVAQALSWVATGRNSPEEKVEWQSAIPSLIDHLASKRLRVSDE